VEEQQKPLECLTVLEWPLEWLSQPELWRIMLKWLSEAECHLEWLRLMK
jgi:hypothetical protein